MMGRDSTSRGTLVWCLAFRGLDWIEREPVGWLVGGRRVGRPDCPATGQRACFPPNTKQIQQAVAPKQHLPDEMRWHGVLRDVDEGVRGQHAAELVAGVVDDGVLP